MKRRLKIRAMVLLLLAALIVVVSGTEWRQRSRLYNRDSIFAETGLTLPTGVRIIDTRAHTLTIADGPNYAWLIESDTSLMSWVTQNMTREDGDGSSWAPIQSLSAVSGFERPGLDRLRVGGVWRAFRSGETSYFFVAEGEKVGVLTTFRP